MGPEIVPASLEPKRPLQTPKLFQGLRPHDIGRRARSGASAPPLRRRTLNGARRGLDLRVARVGIASEDLYQVTILIGREARGLPNEGSAALLHDLFREPFDRLASGRVGGEDPQGVVQQHGAGAFKPPPDGEPEPAGVAGKAGGKEDPGRTGHGM